MTEVMEASRQVNHTAAIDTHPDAVVMAEAEGTPTGYAMPEDSFWPNFGARFAVAVPQLGVSALFRKSIRWDGGDFGGVFFELGPDLSIMDRSDDDDFWVPEEVTVRGLQRRVGGQFFVGLMNHADTMGFKVGALVAYNFDDPHPTFDNHIETAFVAAVNLFMIGDVRIGARMEMVILDEATLPSLIPALPFGNFEWQPR
ncbi:MAG: hypothetical protein HY609_03390 [Deltaproteobacteria bacterium]|nr:hypothetical protein [Deltaproteobacteria bacterium]MBI4223954.1 hypothetical protein [Deltaproteobacteria bacterium]